MAGGARPTCDTRFGAVVIPVSVRKLVKTFGAVRALDDVSVEIARGELFFLLGPSGCGKTTLLRTIAGFYEPDAGRVLFGNADVTRVPPQKRQTGMVFQNYALWPHMTVEANVAFGLRVRHVRRGERRRRVAEALGLVRMEGYARRKPNQLSGGQQQRVALARALVIRPRCLLLDEPLSNLDAKLRLEMRGEIRRLCKDAGLTAIYVTHDQKEALSIADRMAVMFEGRIGQVGAPRELYRRPASRAIADFLGETNFLEGTIVAAAGERRTVQTAVGELTAVTDADAPAGGACVVSIRPEAVMVEPVAPADERGRQVVRTNGDGGGETQLSGNNLTAEVVESVYLGEALQVTLRVGGVRLTASVVESAGRAPLPAGAAVRVSVDPHDVVVLRG